MTVKLLMTNTSKKRKFKKLTKKDSARKMRALFFAFFDKIFELLNKNI